MVILIDLFTSQTSKFGPMTFESSPIYTWANIRSYSHLLHILTNSNYEPFQPMNTFSSYWPFCSFSYFKLTWANYIWFTLGLVRSLIHTLINNISTMSTNQCFFIIWVLLICFLFISQTLTLGPITFTFTLGPKCFFQIWYFVESCVY
jgi:hypothetical protein